MAQIRGKREAPREKRHTLRYLILAVILLALAAVAVWQFVLPQLLIPEENGVSESGEPDAPEPEQPEAEPEAEPEVTAPEAEPEAEPEAGPEAEPETQPAEVTSANLLVNKDNPLPEGYEVELTLLSNGQSVATEIYPDLQNMFDDMRAQGVYPVVASGYRTAEKQQSLMDEKVASFVAEGYSQEDAEAEALLWVNPVGYSEHQTGLAVDINSDGVRSTGDDVYHWLAENAWQYGFILRYPEGKTDLTGTDYEPWHYRYVGKETAKEIYDSGLCLEEYLSAQQ